MAQNPIKILIVEPQPEAQNLLVKIFDSDPDIKVLGIVESGDAAWKFLNRMKPDLITLDIQLPGSDGLRFTRDVMARQPIPIVVIGSSSEEADTAKAFDLLEAGALATVEKPVVGDRDGFDEQASQLISTVKTMAEVKLVRRIRRISGPMLIKKDGRKNLNDGGGAVEIVAIGASTGGPGVIQQILKDLPNDFPLPIVIAQHIAPGFTEGLVHWLATTTGFKVKILEHNDKLQPSTAYLCPEGFQTSYCMNGKIKLTDDGSMHGVKPSVSYLFRSIADCVGDRVIAILLTGMGRDGADELKLIRDKGGVTIVQDAETSLVHGMPGEAIRLGAAQHIIAGHKISGLLIELACAPK